VGQLLFSFEQLEVCSELLLTGAGAMFGHHRTYFGRGQSGVGVSPPYGTVMEFDQVPVGVLEVDASAAIVVIYPARLVLVRIGPDRNVAGQKSALGVARRWRARWCDSARQSYSDHLNWF
jgi:hypothetical protein